MVTHRAVGGFQAPPRLTSWPVAFPPADGPAVVTGCTDDWDIHAQIRTRRLFHERGDQPVEVECVDQTSRITTVAEFVAAMEAGQAAGEYVKSWHVDNILAQIATDPLPEPLRSWWDIAPARLNPRWAWIFLGPAGTSSHMHVDVMCSSAWNLLVTGVKVWEFHPPQWAADHGFLPRDVAHATGAPPDAPSMAYRQEPGEVVVVPSGWAHTVTNVGHTVSLTGNWINASNVRVVDAMLEAEGSTALRNVVKMMETAHQRA